jgi:hypothetical protein
MPTPTYTPLATVTLGSSAASVTFSAIPATYRDLVMVFNGGAAASTTNLRLQVNGETADTNYSNVTMNGFSGNGVQSTANSNNFLARILNFYAFPSADLNTTIVAQFLDANATDKQKTVLARGNNVDNGVAAIALRWANTSRITSLEFIGDQQNLRVGSTFSLYGIVA